MTERNRDISEVLSGLERINDLSIDINDHHYIVLSYLFGWMKTNAFNVAKGVMLDYGCGGQPYKALFSSKVSKYIGADVVTAKGIELDIVIEPNRKLPLDDESIDTVLSTQAIEHANDVDFYLGECSRLLKSGGILILTAPMQWRHHEVPYDYHRFTRYGLIEYLGRHNFSIKEISSCGGVYALLGQIFLNHLSDRGVRKKFIYRFVNRMFLWLDRKFYDTEDTINWLCIAEKKIC
jgi:SAM-dependent methyltransferase